MSIDQGQVARLDFDIVSEETGEHISELSPFGLSAIVFVFLPGFVDVSVRLRLAVLSSDLSSTKRGSNHLATHSFI
jgi:hypothetical protein